MNRLSYTIYCPIGGLFLGQAQGDTLTEVIEHAKRRYPHSTLRLRSGINTIIIEPPKS